MLLTSFAMKVCKRGSQASAGLAADHHPPSAGILSLVVPILKSQENDLKKKETTTHKLMPLGESSCKPAEFDVCCILLVSLGDNMQLQRPRVFHSPRSPHDLEMPILQLPEDFAWLFAFCLGSPANSCELFSWRGVRSDKVL